MKLDDKILKAIEGIERQNQLDSRNTLKKRAQFIGEIKTSLGKEMKINPGKVTFLKKTFGEKIKTFLGKIFTKF